MRFHHFGKCVSQLTTGVTPMQFYACLSGLFYRPRPQLLSEFWTVRNDVQVVRSYKLLQSVIAKSFSSNLAVGTEMAGGRLTSLGFCLLIDWSNSQAQYNRNHVSWSSVRKVQKSLPKGCWWPLSVSSSFPKTAGSLDMSCSGWCLHGWQGWSYRHEIQVLLLMQMTRPKRPEIEGLLLFWAWFW